jgi:hypothetical protein
MAGCHCHDVPTTWIPRRGVKLHLETEHRCMGQAIAEFGALMPLVLIHGTATMGTCTWLITAPFTHVLRREIIKNDDDDDAQLLSSGHLHNLQQHTEPTRSPSKMGTEVGQVGRGRVPCCCPGRQGHLKKVFLISHGFHQP